MLTHTPCAYLHSETQPAANASSLYILFRGDQATQTPCHLIGRWMAPPIDSKSRNLSGDPSVDCLPIDTHNVTKPVHNMSICWMPILPSFGPLEIKLQVSCVAEYEHSPLTSTTLFAATSIPLLRSLYIHGQHFAPSLFYLPYTTHETQNRDVEPFLHLQPKRDGGCLERLCTFLRGTNTIPVLV